MGVGAACMAGIACGADGEMAREMIEDAGRMLVDAGRAVADAGAQLVDAGGRVDGDAAAQGGNSSSETREVACTDAYVRTVKQGSTTTRTVQRVAEIVMDTDGITGVDAIICSPEGDYAPDACPAGATCTGSWRIPTEGCVTGWSASLHPGKVRVLCGSHFTEVNGVVTSQYPRWRTARITIRR